MVELAYRGERKDGFYVDKRVGRSKLPAVNRRS